MATASGKVTALLRPGALRRAVSLLCAAAFLVVTFAHAMHHCGALAVPAAQTVLASFDGGSDGPDKAPAVEHCGICSVVGIRADGVTLPAAPPMARLTVRISHDPRPYIPPADIRPPIA